MPGERDTGTSLERSFGCFGAETGNRQVYCRQNPEEHCRERRKCADRL